MIANYHIRVSAWIVRGNAICNHTLAADPHIAFPELRNDIDQVPDLRPQALHGADDQLGRVLAAIDQGLDADDILVGCLQLDEHLLGFLAELCAHLGRVEDRVEGCLREGLHYLVDGGLDFVELVSLEHLERVRGDGRTLAASLRLGI
jgi:hypothetical protein